MRAGHDLRRRLIAYAGAALVLILVIWLLQAKTTAQVDSYNECTQAGYGVTDTNPPICSDTQQVFLGPALPTPQSQDVLTTQGFELLVDGDSRGTYPRLWQVVDTQEDWQKYWSAIHAALPSLPPILPVDFSTNDVVTLSEGREPTSGYSIKITDISSGPNGSVVDISESIPTITCQVTLKPSTNRYYIVQTAKLIAPVSFRLTPEPRHCN